MAMLPTTKYLPCNIKDIDDKDKYQLGIRAKQATGAITVNLTDSLMLDYNDMGR
jgi:hypothetical protein